VVWRFTAAAGKLVCIGHNSGRPVWVPMIGKDRSCLNLKRLPKGLSAKLAPLHLSKEEQRKRFLERIDEPTKNWKFSLADIEERKFWKQYMKAYQECLSATSTELAPWYVVPADDKENARLIVSKIVLDTFETLDMTYPKTNQKRRLELQSIRKKLAKRS
jgi:Polyphosphate kinase 2 (PPK2)